ncbi:gamma-tubulin complex component, putative [Plasmodium sp. gorilla clade G2]|uniref:gamma-tubulin complex component, putative n=1 Tax=Plasmodium sp. gorilla clade G2 TaxID=880535 RepID=UPI000D22CC62|nr:gamma-tubulin complex component, putative [Plasmodium sp. gorilla clade G2]SOV14508.1 gamma-tubulin complex component, putative [Plasmodium sp. gorilla clade G2]
MNNINFSNTSNTNGNTYIYKENYGNNKLGINEESRNYSKDSDEIYNNNNNNNNNNTIDEINKRKENIKYISEFAKYFFFIAKKIAALKDGRYNNLCDDEKNQKALVTHLIYKLNNILSSLLNFNVLEYNENEKNIKQEIEYLCLKNSSITLNKIRYMLKKLDNNNKKYKYVLYILLMLKEYDDKYPPRIPEMPNKNTNHLNIHHNNNFGTSKNINDNNKQVHNITYNDKTYANNLHTEENSSLNMTRNINEKNYTIKEHTTNMFHVPKNTHNNYNLNNHNINEDTNDFHKNNYGHYNNSVHNFNQINQNEYEENKKQCKLINKNDNNNINNINNNNINNSIILHKNNLVNKSLFANIILNNKFHSLDVEENFLLRDLIYPLQGIDGEFIKYNKNEKIFCVPNRKVSLGMQHLIHNIGSVGMLFKKIKTFITYSNVNHRGKVSIYEDTDSFSSDADDYHYDYNQCDKNSHYGDLINDPNGHKNQYTNNTSNNLQQLKFKLNNENYIQHNTNHNKVEDKSFYDVHNGRNANDFYIKKKNNVDDMNTQGNVNDIHMNRQGNINDIHMNRQGNINDIHMNKYDNVDNIHMNKHDNVDNIYMNKHDNVDNIYMNTHDNVNEIHMNSHVKNGKLLNYENRKSKSSKHRISKYKKEVCMLSKKGSLVIDALYQVIREYINEYYKLLSYIESDINEHIHKNTVYIGIKKLYLLLQESYKILRVLVGVIDESLRNTGCTFLSYLYSKSQTYDYEEQKIYKKILQRCIKPINEILKHWIEYGELKDKYNETFIAANKIVNSEEIWLNKFYLNVNKIPLFLSFSIAKKILMTGKSVYLLNSIINKDMMNNYMNGKYIYNNNNNRNRYISSMSKIKSIMYNKKVLLNHEKEDEDEEEEQKNDYIKKKANKQVDYFNDIKVKRGIDKNDDMNDYKNDDMYEDGQRGVKKIIKKKKKMDRNNNNNNNMNYNNYNNYNNNYYKNDSLYYSRHNNKNKYSEYNDRYIEDEDYDDDNMIDVFSINDINMYIENIDDYINKVSESKNKNLINVLLNNYNLYETFQAFRHFLLLVDGDLFETLFENMKNDLYMNAEELKRHYLNSKLDLCIKSSSLFTQDSNIINKLTLDKFNVKRGDTGWDVLVFDFLVEKPLDIIFTKKIKNIYKSINILLIKLKKIQCELSNMWYLFTHLFKIINIIYYNSLFNFCNTIRNEMFHFIQNILSYFYYDVIDTNWRAFQKKIFLCNNLDQLIKAHYNYITQIQYDLFLGNYHDLILSARRKHDRNNRSNHNNYNNYNSYYVANTDEEEDNYLYNDYSSSYTNTQDNEYIDMEEYYMSNHNLNIYKNSKEQKERIRKHHHQDGNGGDDNGGDSEYKERGTNKYNKNNNEDYIQHNIENESHKCLNKILDIITRFINITSSLVSLICENYNEIKKLIQERKDIDMEEITNEKNDQNNINDDPYQNHDNYIDYINYYINYKIIGESTIKDIKMLLKYYRNYIYKFICLLLGENKFLYMYSKNTNRDKISSLRLLASRLDFNLYYVRLSKMSDRKPHPTKLNISKRIKMMNI